MGKLIDLDADQASTVAAVIIADHVGTVTRSATMRPEVVAGLNALWRQVSITDQAEIEYASDEAERLMRMLEYGTEEIPQMRTISKIGEALMLKIEDELSPLL
jgi:hypothetical protein